MNLQEGTVGEKNSKQRQDQDKHAPCRQQLAAAFQAQARAFQSGLADQLGSRQRQEGHHRRGAQRHQKGHGAIKAAQDQEGQGEAQHHQDFVAPAYRRPGLDDPAWTGLCEQRNRTGAVVERALGADADAVLAFHATG